MKLNDVIKEWCKQYKNIVFTIQDDGERFCWLSGPIHFDVYEDNIFFDDWERVRAHDPELLNKLKSEIEKWELT